MARRGKASKTHRDILTPHRNLNVGNSCDWGVDNALTSSLPGSPGWHPSPPLTPAAHHTRPDGLLRPPKQQQKTRKHSNALRVQRSSSSAAQELQTLHSARRTFAITFVFVNAIADHISVAVAEGSAPLFSLSLSRSPALCDLLCGPCGTAQAQITSFSFNYEYNVFAFEL